MNADACPVCKGEDTELFLHRPAVPVHQNLLLSSKQQARAIERGNLRMIVCGDCGFVFNASFDLNLLQYGENYDNNQACSSSFQQHLDALVSLLIDEKKVRGKQLVEVGCGQGDFLRRLVNEGGNSGIGFDPSYHGSDQMDDGRTHFESRYYDESCTDIPADVVICRHVIEHVPDPVGLLRSVRAAIGDRTDARVYFETPCVDWILDNNVIWDFFYEHCSLFTTASLSSAFQMAGFHVEEVRHVFGGQYLWLEARPVESDVVFSAEPTQSLAQTYGQKEQAMLRQWQQRLEALSEKGKVALWGAGAKGTTFASLIDPECELIDCLVDLNLNKQGKFVAGSGHAIVEPLQLDKRAVGHAILMNPNYRLENEAILNRAGISTILIE